MEQLSVKSVRNWDDRACILYFDFGSTRNLQLTLMEKCYRVTQKNPSILQLPVSR